MGAHACTPLMHARMHMVARPARSRFLHDKSSQAYKEFDRKVRELEMANRPAPAPAPAAPTTATLTGSGSGRTSRWGTQDPAGSSSSSRKDLDEAVEQAKLIAQRAAAKVGLLGSLANTNP
jgi:hypothetical protein